MREIIRTEKFARSFARAVRQGLVTLDDFEHLAYLLAKHDRLPEGYDEHRLSRNLTGYWDAHLGPDVVVIYKRGAAYVRFHDIGTHADVFVEWCPRNRKDFFKAVDSSLERLSREIKRLWQDPD